MRTEDLLEQCLSAISSGQELPPEVARYLAEHPEKRAEVEDLLFIAQRASQLPAAELSDQARSRMQARLASRLEFDPVTLGTQIERARRAERERQSEAPRRKLRLLPGRLHLARLRYEPPPPPRDPVSEARIREAFRGLTPEDLRRYIGVRGIDYLYYRQAFPYWRPIFACIAALVRGFKRIEQLVAVSIRD